jgi:hypothetical protein
MVSKRDKSVHEITGAAPSRSSDVMRREVRYAISMGIRTVCFILAIIVHGWARGIAIAAALLLPYVSVIYANNSRPKAVPAPAPYVPDGPPALDQIHHGPEQPQPNSPDVGSDTA